MHNARTPSRHTLCRRLAAMLALAAALAPCAAAAAPNTGFGRKPIESFDLEKPAPAGDYSTAKLNLPAVNLPGLPAASEIMKAGANGRVQLFSVAQLSEQDMRNPFQIRVQVAVDVRETTIEIGGIIESPDDPGRNTVFIISRPTDTRKAGEPEPEADPGAAKPPSPPKPAQKARPVSRVCSVGDTVEGFRIHAIMRNSIIVEQSGKYVEIPRGGPVTICVPVSHNL